MQLTGGEAVVRTLEAQGVDTVFGMPGVHNLAVYDALRDSGIRHIVARHEQGAAFMADGYARATGRVGVCLCTSGPALLNSATPLGTAYCDSSPVLCIASQIPSYAIGKEKGYIHECRDQLGCVRPVTAWSERANAVASIPAVLNEAFARMRNGRPRPVVVEIPCDVLDGRDNAKFPSVDATQPTAADGPATQQDQIERAVRLLRQARRPIIWAGGGVTISGGSDQVRQLAELLGAPVLTTVQGKGSIPEDHPLALGSIPVHPAVVDYLASCDVMLAVGTRFTEEDTLEFSIQVPPTMIHVDIDPEELGRNYAPTLGVVGDARHVLGQMLLHLADDSTRSSDRAEEVATLRQRILRDCRELAPAGVELVETLRLALPRQTVVVSDLAIGAYWCRRLFDVYEPRSFIYPWGFCTLGFGLPAGIGAKAARPDRPVVVLTGDGGFMFNCQELAVSAQFQLPVIVVLFNNRGFGVMKPQQQVRYGRTLAVDLVNPDFALLAQAFGFAARRVSEISELGPAVAAAVESETTCLIEVTADLPLQVMEPAMRRIHLALTAN